MYSVISNLKFQIKKCIADFEADIHSIPLQDFAPGSTCFVIETSKSYMLNHNREWIEVELSAAGDPTSPDTVIYNGGAV